jgi:hypothetical protein
MGIDTRFHGAGRSNLGPRDERMVRIAGYQEGKGLPTYYERMLLRL